MLYALAETGLKVVWYICKKIEGNMRYNNIRKAKFIERLNRFIAKIEIDGEVVDCHVKNTGRCKELLLSGADIYVEESDNPNRKTKYDLISVYKGDLLINMDSQVPNKVVGEWLKKGHLFENISLIKPEKVYGKSRFDFYVEEDADNKKDKEKSFKEEAPAKRKAFIEVKGVTLELDGVVKFPDAPTERGVKHLKELAESIEEGYEAYVIFVIQMQGMKYFTPNEETHKEFADTLREVVKRGVKVLAYGCEITEDSIDIIEEVPVRL